MPATKLNLVIERGADFDPLFTWKKRDANGVETLQDLTGFEARAHFRESIESDQPFLSLRSQDGNIVLGGVNGTIQFKVPAVDTTPIAPDAGVWDLEMIAPVTGHVTRLLEGKVKVKPEVTR